MSRRLGAGRRTAGDVELARLLGVRGRELRRAIGHGWERTPAPGGDPPTVTRVQAGRLNARAVAEAARLQKAHLGGTVAVISTAPNEMIRMLTSGGFQKGRGRGAD